MGATGKGRRGTGGRGARVAFGLALKDEGCGEGTGQAKASRWGLCPRVVRDGAREVGRGTPSRALNARMRGTDFVLRTRGGRLMEGF